MPGVTLTVNSLNVVYNTGTPGPLDWTTALATPLVITDANGGTHPINFSASTPLKVSGTATINLFNLVAGTVGFSLTTQTVTNVSVGGGPVLASGTLTTIGLTVSNLFLGVGGIGFTLTSGSVTVAILSPTATTDTRRWTAVSAQLGGASLVGIPGITLTATELDIDVNQASTGATPLNWTTAFGGSITPPVTLSGPLLEIAATASLSIGSFVYASGSFVIESGGDVYVTPAGATGTVHVSLLELGVSNANVFAGVGANDSTGAGGIGVSLSSVSLGLALMSEIGGSRSYIGLSASGGASLIGVPGITLVGTVQVQVNSASTGAAVDFTQLTAGMLAVPTAPGSGAPTVNLAFTGALLQVSGSLTLSIDGFASVSGNFAFQQGGTVNVTTEGGGSGTATALEIGASNASAFFGVGANNPSGPGAMGLSITGVTFGLALLKATAPINGATSFVALKASGNVALVGITGITASMTNATVSVNEAYDAGGNVIAQAVNFTGHNLSIATGGAPVTLDFAGSTFAATGTISIAIGSFVYVSGTVAFGKGTTLNNVTLAGSSAHAEPQRPDHRREQRQHLRRRRGERLDRRRRHRPRAHRRHVRAGAAEADGRVGRELLRAEGDGHVGRPRRRSRRDHLGHRPRGRRQRLRHHGRRGQLHRPRLLRRDRRLGLDPGLDRFRRPRCCRRAAPSRSASPARRSPRS